MLNVPPEEIRVQGQIIIKTAQYFAPERCLT